MAEGSIFFLRAAAVLIGCLFPGDVKDVILPNSGLTCHTFRDQSIPIRDKVNAKYVSRHRWARSLCFQARVKAGISRGDPVLKTY